MVPQTEGTGDDYFHLRWVGSCLPPHSKPKRWPKSGEVTILRNYGLGSRNKTRPVWSRGTI